MKGPSQAVGLRSASGLFCVAVCAPSPADCLQGVPLGRSQPIRDRLAFASRNCPQEILLLVWRIVPQVKAGLQGVPRRPSCKSTYDLQPPSTRREKSSTGRSRPPEHRQSCHVLYDGNHEFALNGWERYTELGKAPQQHTMPPPSRPPSSSGTDKNYIILTPLNPGGQVGPCGTRESDFFMCGRHISLTRWHLWKIERERVGVQLTPKSYVFPLNCLAGIKMRTISR